jgi:hypothetical protein
MFINAQAFSHQGEQMAIHLDTEIFHVQTLYVPSVIADGTGQVT